LSQTSNIVVQYFLLQKADGQPDYFRMFQMRRKLTTYLKAQVLSVLGALLMGVYFMAFFGVSPAKKDVPVSLAVGIALVSVCFFCLFIFAMVGTAYFLTPFREFRKSLDSESISDRCLTADRSDSEVQVREKISKVYMRQAVLQIAVMVSMVACYMYLVLSYGMGLSFRMEAFAVNACICNLLLMLIFANLLSLANENSSREGLYFFGKTKSFSQNQVRHLEPLSSIDLDADTLPSQTRSTLVIDVLPEGAQVRPSQDLLEKDNNDDEVVYGQLNLLHCGKLAVVDGRSSSTGKLEGGAHAIVRVSGEAFLRVSYEISEFGMTTGHKHLFKQGETVIFAGEVETDANNYLLKWSNFAEGYKVNARGIGQAGLPYEQLWIWCGKNDEVYVRDEAEKIARAEQGSLMCIPSGGQLLSIGAAANFDVGFEVYQACKDLAQELTETRQNRRDVSLVQEQQGPLDYQNASQLQSSMTASDIKTIIKRGREERKAFLASKGFARPSQL
jgi:hypothetical protein